MPKKAEILSAIQVKRLSRPGNHNVGGVAGLLLQVTESGARSWVLRAVVGQKRRDIGLGGYPDVTLEQARERARQARDLIRQGIDPVSERKARREALIKEQANQMTFQKAAMEAYKVKSKEFRNAKHRADWISSLERYAFPIIGQISVADVDVGHIQKVLEPIWYDKTETATRLRQRLEQVLSWASAAKKRSGENPARWKENLEHILSAPTKIRKVEHYRALPWQEAGGFMAELREREGLSARALEFIILTASRSGEVRLATWDEIDLDNKLWTIPAERMKAKRKHTVPLSADAIRILKALPRFAGSDYVFTSPRGGALSDMSVSAVTRRMGVDAVPHGFRSNFKDWARNCTRYADEVSELALAHVNNDATRAAYARDELLPQRVRLMSEWAKYLRTPAKSAEVVAIRRAKA